MGQCSRSSWLATGALIGLVNGFAVARLKMIPFVVTLATMTVISGTSVWMTNSLSISQLAGTVPRPFRRSAFSRIPITVLIVAILGIIVTILMRSSIAGRWAYAVGISEKASRVARIPIAHVVLASYVFAGLMAGVTGILLTARLGAASANMGNDGMVLDIVSACVVGGISIYGGSGRIPRRAVRCFVDHSPFQRDEPDRRFLLSAASSSKGR